MSSFSHLRFWVALVSMICLIIGLCLIDGFLHVSDGNGTLGAFLGFLIGGTFLTKAIYVAGLDTYAAGLPRTNEEATKPVMATLRKPFD